MQVLEEVVNNSYLFVRKEQMWRSKGALVARSRVSCTCALGPKAIHAAANNLTRISVMNSRRRMLCLSIALCDRGTGEKWHTTSLKR